MAWKNQQERRRGTPSSRSVYKYWFSKGLHPQKGNEFIPLEEGTCFACGLFHSIQRAHIVPVSEGGNSSVDNIHLLCKGCHCLSEGNKKYWQWLSYMRLNEWKTRPEWCLKILERNGLSIEEEWHKIEHLDFYERIVVIQNILKENGIIFEAQE
jgi:hypothetical protein